MLVCRTRLGWRIVYWTVAAVDVVLLTAALAAGDVGAAAFYGVATLLFGVLALQSRGVVAFSPTGIEDQRLLLQRSWSWGDVRHVELRARGWIRPPIVVRAVDRGAPLALNHGLLRAERDGLPLSREDLLDAVATLARQSGAEVVDHR